MDLPASHRSKSSEQENVRDFRPDHQYATWEKEVVLPQTSLLLETLPFDLYPYATARSYPHVLNVLVRHWADRAAFIEAAAAFLHCRDWPRQGFPRLVFFEILSLVAYNGSLPDLGQLDLQRLNLDQDPMQTRLFD